MRVRKVRHGTDGDWFFDRKIARMRIPRPPEVLGFDRMLQFGVYLSHFCIWSEPSDSLNLSQLCEDHEYFELGSLGRGSGVAGGDHGASGAIAHDGSHFPTWGSR